MSEIEEKLNSILSSPEEMEKISNMAKSLMDSGSLGALGSMFSTPSQAPAQSDSNKNDENTLENLLGNIDPSILSSIGQLMSGPDTNNKKYALLNALIPHLAEKRQAKMMKAMQIARVAKIAKNIFVDKGGGGNV